MKMRVLAIDLGGTHARCALVEGSKVLQVAELRFSDLRFLAPLLPQIESVLRGLMAGSTEPIAGIGLGFCGLVDARVNRVSSTNKKFIDAPGLDLPGWAREQFGLPLLLENDARLALLGECYTGAAQHETDVVMFTLGTGIGGVAMVEGRLLRGKHGQAGVLGGHVPVRFNGRTCTCGAIGCAESEASGWSLPLVCAEWPGFADSSLSQGEINFKNLFSCAASGDPVSSAIRDHCLQVWGAAAVGAVHAFDPELLVYGGGVMRSADAILPFIEGYVAQHAWTPWGKVRVRAAKLGDDAALLGAIPLLKKELQDVR
jgi:glucokinase